MLYSFSSSPKSTLLSLISWLLLNFLAVVKGRSKSYLNNLNYADLAICLTSPDGGNTENFSRKAFLARHLTSWAEPKDMKSRNVPAKSLNITMQVPILKPLKVYPSPRKASIASCDKAHWSDFQMC